DRGGARDASRWRDLESTRARSHSPEHADLGLRYRRAHEPSRWDPRPERMRRVPESRRPRPRGARGGRRTPTPGRREPVTIKALLARLGRIDGTMRVIALRPYHPFCPARLPARCPSVRELSRPLPPGAAPLRGAHPRTRRRQLHPSPRPLRAADVLVLDDWGLGALRDKDPPDAPDPLEDRTGTRPTIVTSQLPPAKWHDHLADPAVADAICDRLLHPAHRIVLKGPSRKKEASPES